MPSPTVTTCWLLILLWQLLCHPALAADCACQQPAGAPRPAAAKAPNRGAAGGCCQTSPPCDAPVFGPLRFAAAQRVPRGRGIDHWLGRTSALERGSLFGQSQSPAIVLAAAEDAYSEATQGERRGSGDCVDDYFRAALLSWRYLSTTGFDLSATGAASRVWDLYHSSLGRLIITGQQFRRLDPRRGLLIGTPTGLMTVAVRHRGFPWQADDFKRLMLVGAYREKSLNHIYRRPGLGVPLLVIRHRTGSAPPGERPVGPARFFNATAILRPAGPELARELAPSGTAIPRAGLAVLELYDPLRTSCVDGATQTVPLASDTSAAAALALQSSDWQPLQEYFRPDTETEATLIMVEPYQRGKIPLVFVHGLLSDPSTYLDIANETIADPHLSASYQIWAFSYPTGGPFLASGARLRTLLRTTIARTIATCGDDPALHHMIIVGHSMGGLITKLQVTASGNTLWNHAANRPFDQMVLNEEDRKELTNRFFFTPLPFVDRVVMIATPHDGSPWAKRLIGQLGRQLVEFSGRDDQRYEKILRDNPGAIKAEFSEGLPTSVDMLKEGNQILTAERQLRIDSRVRVHSIIGTGHRLIRDGPADGIVTVPSARHPGAVSEAYIAATHTTILRDLVTTREIKRILYIHLAESRCHDTAPAMAAQDQTVR